MTREQLAKALYETDPGTNGYPPLHLSIPWRDTMHRDFYYERADEILRRAAAPVPAEKETPNG